MNNYAQYSKITKQRLNGRIHFLFAILKINFKNTIKIQILKSDIFTMNRNMNS